MASTLPGILCTCEDYEFCNIEQCITTAHLLAR
jgi:hypothetical protein